MAIIEDYKIVDRTEAINKVVPRPSILDQMGFFQYRPVNQDTITFDVGGNQLKVLNDKLRSTDDRNTVDPKQYDQHVIKLPHHPVESVISRDTLGGIRAFDSESEKAVAQAVAEHLGDHVEKHEYHFEYQRAKMLFDAEIVTDYHGTYSMASEFGISQGTKTLSHAASGDTLKQFREMARASKENLISGRASSFVLFAGNDLFEWLVVNPDFNEAFKLFMGSGQNPLMNQFGETGGQFQSFNFGNVLIVNFDESFIKPDGTTDQILADGAGLFVPRARLGRFFAGPENSLNGLSQGGQKYFAKQVRDDMDRFITMYSESNTMPILESPGATIKVDFTP